MTDKIKVKLWDLESNWRRSIEKKRVSFIFFTNSFLDDKSVCFFGYEFSTFPKKKVMRLQFGYLILENSQDQEEIGRNVINPNFSEIMAGIEYQNLDF